MCRLDWNADGLEDICVSHLLSRAELVSNRTANPNSHVAFRLFRRNGSRTTTGTHLELKLPKQQFYRQAVSGDGYMASNEKRFVFGGIGKTQNAVLKIRWPNQHGEEFRLPTGAGELAVVENRGFYVLPK